MNEMDGWMWVDGLVGLLFVGLFRDGFTEIGCNPLFALAAQPLLLLRMGPIACVNALL